MLRLRMARCALICTAVVMADGMAEAATEWSVEPQAMVQTLHNSNPYLAYKGRRSNTAHHLNLNLPIIAESEISQLKLDPQLHVIRNPGWHYRDRDEYTISFDAKRLMELGSYGLNGAVTHNTTLTSEFLDTGYVGVKKWRNFRAISPYLHVELTPSTTLTATLRYQNQNYEHAGGTPLVGYDYTQAMLSLLHELDEFDTLNCSINRSRIRRGAVDSEDAGGSCSLTRQMTERLHGSVTFGGHRTTVFVNNTELQSRSGSLAAFELSYERINARWHLNGSRTVKPSGYGLLMRTDQLSVGAAYGISEHLSANANIIARRYVMTTSLYDVPKRDYGVAQWRLVWQWMPEWSITAGMDFARQRYSYQTSYANATTVLMQLNYRFESR